MQYISLASGSSGNCHYVFEKDTGILVDAGIALKNIKESLQSHDVDMQSIKAVLLTHEHTDHAKSAGAVSRKLDVPIFATQGTFDAMESKLGKVKEHNIKVIGSQDEFDIGDLHIKSHKISHDAKEPVAFRVFDADSSISFLTDLGIVKKDIMDFINKSNAVVLEANHDVNMLEAGPYPYELKRRIKSQYGHISNDIAGKVSCELVKNGTTRIMLAHLSMQNNMPVLAFQSVASILRKSNIQVGCDLELQVLEPFMPSEMIHV